MARLEDSPVNPEWMQAAKQELALLEDIKQIAGFLTAKRAELIEWAAGLPGRQKTRLLSDLIDLVIRRMYSVACQMVGGQAMSSADRALAIVATGGYGRQELAPYSDIDLNFLSSADDDPEVDAITRAMFRLIMDVFLAEARMKVGYAYRLLGEAGSLHHQNQTALLDARYVAGSKEVYRDFQAELRRNIHPVAFYHDKVRERELSIRRKGGAIYRVEPDIKEGEGSLRDLHLASWLAQVAWGFPNRSVWEDIRAHGLLTATEVDRVYEVQEFYSSIRWEMHLNAGQQADHLTVPKQEFLARKLGYADSPEETGVERLMRQYYGFAEVARQAAEKMMSQAESQMLQLEPGLGAKSGQVVLLNPEVFLNDPVASLRAFGYCQRYGLRLSQGVLDAIRSSVPRMVPPNGSTEAARLFLMILRSEDVAETLISMARCGVLQWFIPAFGEIMGLVPADAAHEYTVGWHSLLVVKHCERLGREGDEDMKRIFASIRQPEMLYLFALTHDIGKVGGTGNHSEKGADIAHDLALKLGLDEEFAGRLEFLVRHHLLMSDTARLRDLNLRKTVDDFVSVIDDVDALSMLYIHTNADILAVGSAAWSEIQGRFLRELYYRAERAIVNRTPLINTEEDMELYRSRVRRELSLTNLPPEQVEEHVESMPALYLLNTGPEEMAQHIEFIDKAKKGQPSTDFRSELGSDFTEFTVCVRDDAVPGLLAKIAGVLWALDIEVHAAQVFTRENGDRVALDTLYVDFEGKQLPEFKKHQLTRNVLKVLNGEITVPELLMQKHKILPAEYHSISMEAHQDLSDQHTVVDVVAADQPGLLYRFTRAFANLGWSIHSARITTWGNEARDSFYVTAGDTEIDDSALELLEQEMRSLGIPNAGK